MKHVRADSPECDRDPWRAAFAWFRSARYYAQRIMCRGLRSLSVVWRVNYSHTRSRNDIAWVRIDIHEGMQALHTAISSLLLACPWVLG